MFHFGVLFLVVVTAMTIQHILSINIIKVMSEWSKYRINNYNRRR